MISQKAALKIRQRFEQFTQLKAEYGFKEALELMMSGHSDVQQKLMGPLITNRPLAEAFRQAIPIFERFGMKMEVVDLSNQNTDAVLEIQRICPYKALAKEFNLQTPCQITCDMDVTAIQQAFPEIKGKILSKLANGDSVCLFMYQRTRST